MCECVARGPLSFDEGRPVCVDEAQGAQQATVCLWLGVGSRVAKLYLREKSDPNVRTAIWLQIVMPHALDRGVSDHPTPTAAAASAAACMARDAARGWRLPWTRTHTARHESKWHLAPAYHAMPQG